MRIIENFLAFTFICFKILSAQVSKNDLMRIRLSADSWEVLSRSGLLDCGVHVKSGCCLIGDFPETVAGELNPLDFVILERPAIALEKSGLGACEKGTFPSVQNFQLGNMGGFYRLAEVDSEMARMHQLFPQYVSQKYTIPGLTTHQGRPLSYYRISDNPDLNEQEPAIFYGAAIHAREPISVSNLIYFLWFLLENAAQRPDLQFLIENSELYVMPMINPDGYYYNETTAPNGGGNWRKNMRNNGDGTWGVDLNRNFPFAWGWDDLGSSPDPASFTYRGPSPASEPEVQAVIWLANQEKFKFSLMHHSYGNFLIHPWNYIPQAAPDSLIFRSAGHYLTRENNFLTGTCQETVGYLANGGSDDYLYGDTSAPKGRIHALTPETGTYYDGFWPMQERIIPLCHRNLWMNLAPLYLLFPTLQHNLTPPIILPSGQEHVLRFQWQRVSDTNAVFLRSVQSLSPYIQIPASLAQRQIFYPAPFTALDDSLVLNVLSGAPQGTSARVVLSWHNGVFERTDTLSFILGAPETIFYTSCDNNSPETFTAQGWGFSSQSYISSPASITDSPFGNYPPNAEQTLIFNKVINLAGALAAELRYRARWETEKSYDIVVPFARIILGDEVPLCGQYTFPVFSAPPSGPASEQPAYDGMSAGWIEEHISLAGLLGEKFQLGFRLYSDSYVEKDGFYLDDVQIIKIDPFSAVVPSVETSGEKPLIIVQKPGLEQLLIHIQNVPDDAYIYIYNIAGALMWSKKISKEERNININLNIWSSGVYMARLNGWCERFIVKKD